MQKAETVLNVIQKRGECDQKLERLYRQLYNTELYIIAYAKLYPNKGALTPGITDETADGMSLTKIYKLVEELRHERFRWTPVRRTYIPKREKQTLRPLGIPAWRDKLVQEVIRILFDMSPSINHFVPRCVILMLSKAVWHPRCGLKPCELLENFGSKYASKSIRITS